MDEPENSVQRTGLRYFFSKDFTVTKRHLGIFLLLAGIAGFAGILAIDVLNVGREGGIGPAQKAALGLCVAMAVLGVTLIPLGDTPA
jgi:hypothetical protein